MKLLGDLPDLLKLDHEKVKAIAEECKRCSLSKGRTKVVFGAGPVPCDLMLIGEAPGADEDVQGLPFVGRAGQLLTKILESIGINRETDIYITNTVKCRPPENRAPLSNETEACYPYLEAQIHHLKPKIIILAGSPATKMVLKNDEPISKIRGKWFKLPGTDISVMPIFHPSYLLRNPSKEKGRPKWLTWQDVQEVKTALSYLKQIKELGG
ncbi:MAG: uracil-DNA glycosylase [Candidatus Saganbacteria bacterium]|nr:uracil-DNA glycosylase [Candidatus Saganbacteria bacterium]